MSEASTNPALCKEVGLAVIRVLVGVRTGFPLYVAVHGVWFVPWTVLSWYVACIVSGVSLEPCFPVIRGHILVAVLTVC